MEKSYYVYIDKKPCGEVFYVGKGDARRVKQKQRNRFHTFVTNKYPAWTREIVFVGNEQQCLDYEENLISQYGRKNLGEGTLVNLCDGGLGIKKYKMPENLKNELSKNWQAQKNPLYNKIKYDWVNLDTGEKESKTMYEMHKQYGGSRPHWTSVTTGERKSHKGWTLIGTDINFRSSKGKKFKFENKTGIVFEGTQSEFAKFANISFASACRVTKKQADTGGWHVKN